MRILVFLIVTLLTTSAHAVEHSKWTTFLTNHVHDGLVDYKNAARDDGLLRNYLAEVASTDFSTLSDTDRLAYLINAYNAYTVALIIDNRDGDEMVESIKDIGGFFSSPWKKKFATLGGKEYSLDQIEHELIREQFADPRVHFALNCASYSCPPLAPVAYEGELLHSQLERQTRSFINNSDNTYLEESALHISKLFDWYDEDFTSGIFVFIRAHAEGELLAELESIDKVSLKYLPYDWSLNIVNE